MFGLGIENKELADVQFNVELEKRKTYLNVEDVNFIRASAVGSRTLRTWISEGV